MTDTSVAAFTADDDAKENDADDKEIDPARAALVKKWCKIVKADRDHWKDEFKRMDECIQLAAEGATKDWIDGDNYVVPLANRHINQAVASLYARNPKVIAKRKSKLMYQLWDGDIQSLQAAMIAASHPAPIANPTLARHVIDTATGAKQVDPNGDPVLNPPVGQRTPPLGSQPAPGDPGALPQGGDGNPLGAPPQPGVPPDPNAIALIQEVQSVRTQLIMYERLGRTMELCFDYFLGEQDTGYREEIKATVRRAKVTSVGYIKLGFQRQLQRRPDIDAQIADITSQIARIEALMASAAEGEIDQDAAEMEELRLLLQDLQSQAEIIVREGPVLSFPGSKEIIVDRNCKHLKTFAGCKRVAQEFDLTPDEVLEIYGVDIKERGYEKYNEEGTGKTDDSAKAKARIWEIQDKDNQQVLTVCDGYPDFLKEPADPDVKIERFWTIFPLVFNEAEDRVYPISDVWAVRHMQKDYNTSRQGLREHRLSARPRYAVPKGKLEDADKTALSSSPPHSIIEVSGMLPGDDVSKMLQRVPAAPIDQALYETESTFADIQRSVGSQEANFGGASSRTTATESSISENSRTATQADNIDDLDCMLTALARGMGQLMLLELDIQTVKEICGPGAVWPQVTPRREEIAKDLYLDIEAGSSGRPNRAAEMANLERAMPYITQLPGVNPMPFVKKYAQLLDIDSEDMIVEGLPSIAAMNQAGPIMAGGGGPKPPNMQGGNGANNAPHPPGAPPGPQPGFPSPSAGLPPPA